MFGNLVNDLVKKVVSQEQIDAFLNEVSQLNPQAAKEKIQSFLPMLPVPQDVKDLVESKLSIIDNLTSETIQTVLGYIKNALGK